MKHFLRKHPWIWVILLFVLYLSLFSVGQMFFSFQWETLLLETGFLAILLAAFGPSRLATVHEKIHGT